MQNLADSPNDSGRIGGDADGTGGAPRFGGEVGALCGRPDRASATGGSFAVADTGGWVAIDDNCAALRLCRRTLGSDASPPPEEEATSPSADEPPHKETSSKQDRLGQITGAVAKSLLVLVQRRFRLQIRAVRQKALHPR
ncbi:hypothetical protein GUJ93_ZPchr0003g17736 [Zizania palustris]|uniref:Uncharacterized protein n=1 Tax=Zizania palustris TaxID=103762 RepID=A0A8J5V7W8_ZIZPA|nr:hypothetical protein GUJ93_ZPchr0003g17736 [Zizania palustris]